MNRGLVITGVVLLVLGVATAGYSIAAPHTATIYLYPTDTNPFPQVLTPSTLTLSWSGGSSSTSVELFECPTSACDRIASVLVNQSGASGSFTATLQPGQTYALTAFGSTSVSASFTVSGLTVLVLVGLVLAIVGVVVMVLGWTRKRRAPAEPVEAWESTAASGAAPAPPERAAETAAQAEASAASSSTPAPAESGGRANRQCGHCGTMNEPWITNCRKCKRPLASTSGT